MDEELKYAIRDLQDVITLLGGRWRMAILAVLCEKPLRYSEIRGMLRPITAKVLTQELRYLEENKMVERMTGTLSGNSSVYRMSSHAETLRPIIVDLWEWAKAHRTEVLRREDNNDERVRSLVEKVSSTSANSV